MAEETRVDLDRLRLGLALMRLGKLEETILTKTVYTKIVRAWDPMYGPVRNDRRYCSVKLTESEMELYRSLAIPPVLVFGYAAVYVDPQDPTVEVTIRTKKRPPAKATFNVRGGKRRLTRTSITELEHHMARTKNAPVDELDDLDDLDLDDDEDEAPAPKAKAKTETPAAKRKRLKAEAAAAEAEEDAEDEDEEDAEDEDEEEEPAPKPKAKKAAKPAAKAKGTPVGRALPEGKWGVQDVADAAGTSGRAVRIYCRTNDIEKAEGLGRYAWTEKQGTMLAKKIKAGK